MLKSVKAKELYYYSVCSIAFFIPLFPKLLPYLISFSVITFLISNSLREIVRKLVMLKTPLLFIGLYIFYLSGLLYSENLKYGWNDVGTKLSLLIFPVILADDKIRQENYFRLVLKFFIWGCLAVCGLLLARACYLYFFGTENAFYYETFSYFFHPTYLSLYINFASGILVLQLFAGNKRFSPGNLILLLFFAVIIFLLSSKTGIICFILILSCCFLIIGIRERKIKYFAGFLVVCIGFYWALRDMGRIKNAARILWENQFDIASAESTAARVNIWNASLKIISDNLLFGVGTGDVKDELLKSYQNQNMSGALQNKLNAHNQFLQTFIALGLLGFLVLLLSLLVPGFHSIRDQNGLYLIFLSLIFLNFMTESILERQNGVVFYGFFNALLFYGAKNKMKI